MSLPLIVRARARRDVQRAREWLDGQKAGLGDRMFKELIKTFRRIEANPFGYEEVEPGVRQATLKKFPYSVYYYVDDIHVAVLVVVHQSRDESVWKNRVAEELDRADDD